MAQFNINKQRCYCGCKQSKAKQNVYSFIMQNYAEFDSHKMIPNEREFPDFAAAAETHFEQFPSLELLHGPAL